MARVLVTGMQGFTGPYVARALTEVGHDVVDTEAWPEFDLRKPETLTAALRSARPDHVVHLAGLSSVTHGDAARRLGAAGAAAMGKRWGVAVQGGTDAIAAALRILGVGPGARVALPAYMCGAALDACALLGASPVFVDVAEATLAIDPAKVNAERGLAAVVAAHLFGVPAPVWEIRAAPVVEDCAQTLGVPAGGRPAGGHGVLAMTSFYGTKLLAAGHGGLLAGDDTAHEKAAWALFLHDKIETWTPHSSGRAVSTASSRSAAWTIRAGR